VLVWVDVLLDVVVEVLVAVLPELVFPELAPAVCASVDATAATKKIADASASIEEGLNTAASV
jgi:hypothetical protein